MLLANRTTAARLLIGAAAWLILEPALVLEPALAAPAPARVDAQSIAANSNSSKDWPTYGLDYAETRFSRLKQVNTGNVGKLGLVWTYDLESKRGVEATPLVVDGVMYVTASWSVVHAIDVRTGRRVIRRHVAAHAVLGAAVADDDLAVGDARRTGDRVRP